MQYRAADTNAGDNQIKPHFNIVNAGASAVPLSELKVRYWYTIDGNLPQIARRGLDIHPSGFDLRQIEHIVDQIEQVGAAGADRIEGVTLVWPERAITLQQLGVADDAVERHRAAAHLDPLEPRRFAGRRLDVLCDVLEVRQFA